MFPEGVFPATPESAPRTRTSYPWDVLVCILGTTIGLIALYAGDLHVAFHLVPFLATAGFSHVVLYFAGPHALRLAIYGVAAIAWFGLGIDFSGWRLAVSIALGVISAGIALVGGARHHR